MIDDDEEVEDDDDVTWGKSVSLMDLSLGVQKVLNLLFLTLTIISRAI
jgi:hypothetical protein